MTSPSMTPPIERIPEWHLSAKDEAAIAALLARCFSTDFQGRSFFTHHHHLRLVMRDGPAIISHMALVLRSIDIGPRRVTIAGLAEVATHPDHRGQGLAASLLQAAVAESRESPAEYLLLFGVARLYAAAGFQTVANPLVHTTLTADRVERHVTQGHDHLMVLPLRAQPWPATALVDLRGPMF